MEKGIYLFFLVLFTSIIGGLTLPQQIVAAGNQNTSGPSSPVDIFFDEDELEKDYPTVVSLIYHLKEELLMEFFTKLALVDIQCPISECNITLVDVVEATQMWRFTTEDLAEALLRLNIGQNDFHNILFLYRVDLPTIEYLLQVFELTFSELYGKFVKSLTNPGRTIPEVLTALNVSVVDFMTEQAYGNDSTRLQVLSTGNYSQKNLNDVLNITGKTAMDMLRLIPLNTSASRVKNLDGHELGNFVKNLGVNTANLLDLYRYLNLTSINFLTYPSFIRIVTGVYDFLNAEETLGVVVSKTKVVTSNKAKVLLNYRDQSNEIIRTYAKFYVQLVENPLVQYTVRNVSFFNPEYQSGDLAFVETTVPFTTNFTEVAKTYNVSVLVNCTYISKLPFGGIYSENISNASLNNYTITISKSSETIYNLGSPLFCQDKLYGIATKNYPSKIQLATLAKKVSTVTTTKPGSQLPSPTQNATTPTNTVKPNPSSGTMLRNSVITIFVTVIALLLS